MATLSTGSRGGVSTDCLEDRRRPTEALSEVDPVVFLGPYSISHIRPASDRRDRLVPIGDAPDLEGERLAYYRAHLVGATTIRLFTPHGLPNVPLEERRERHVPGHPEAASAVHDERRARDLAHQHLPEHLTDLRVWLERSRPATSPTRSRTSRFTWATSSDRTRLAASRRSRCARRPPGALPRP